MRLLKVIPIRSRYSTFVRIADDQKTALKIEFCLSSLEGSNPFAISYITKAATMSAYPTLFWITPAWHFVSSTFFSYNRLHGAWNLLKNNSMCNILSIKHGRFRFRELYRAIWTTRNLLLLTNFIIQNVTDSLVKGITIRKWLTFTGDGILPTS